MSRENIELVKSIYAEWSQGDYSASAWAHPEIEYAVAEGPDMGSSTGLAEMASRQRQVLQPWEELRVAAEELRELDDDRVLVLSTVTGRGRRSGLDASQIATQGAQLFEIRDGKVTRLVQYYTRERAFADLGLTE
jgi:ketosteroid isomerase-like protein